MDTHLNEPCPRCQADLARLRTLLDAMAAPEAAIAPPEALVRRAVESFHRRAENTLAPRLRHLANLLFDSYRQAPLGATRGASPARQLLFSAGELEIDLQVTPTHDSLTLLGQVLAGDKPEAAPAAVVRLHRAGEVLDSTHTDSFGRFAFRPLPAGRYTVTLEFASREIEILGLDLGNA